MHSWIFSTAPPSVPQSTSITSPAYRLSDFTTVVQWGSPGRDGGVGIDSYTLTGAGITAPLTVLSNEPLMATLTLSYNEMHMVNITASNCAGESTASVVTIHEGKRLIIYIIIRHTVHTCICCFQLAVAPQLHHPVDPWETSPAHRRGQR